MGERGTSIQLLHLVHLSDRNTRMPVTSPSRKRLADELLIKDCTDTIAQVAQRSRLVGVVIKNIESLERKINM